jgi:hypothetical protein
MARRPTQPRTDYDLPVTSEAAPRSVPEHGSERSITAVLRFVQSSSTEEGRSTLGVCSCVPVVDAKCVSARAATVVSSIAVAAVARLHVVSRGVHRRAVTNKAGVADTAMPSVSVVIGRGVAAGSNPTK